MATTKNGIHICSAKVRIFKLPEVPSFFLFHLPFSSKESYAEAEMAQAARI